jgi:hypothetical protein
VVLEYQISNINFMNTSPFVLTFAVFSLLALLETACGSKCDAGFESENGVCICPDDRFMVDESCVILEDNQFYWIRSCSCLQDTVRLKFVPSNILGIPYAECRILSGSTTQTVFNTVDNGKWDTIATGGNLAGSYCPVQGKDCVVKFEGVLAHPDTIRGNLVYRWGENLDSIIQVCPTLMWRK